jgi:single-strand DNA-binding protein
MSSYEKLILVGNLGQDPELRFLEDGTAVTSLSVAVNKKRGEQRTTTWYRVSVWNGSAENACKFLKKGSKVLVEASNLRVSQYTTRDGKPAVGLEVTADHVVYLDSPEDTTTPSGEESGELPF